MVTGTEDKDPAQIEGVTWDLLRLRDDAGDREVSSVAAFLRVDADGRLNGKAGNGFGGHVEVAAERLLVGRTLRTLMKCHGLAAEVDDAMALMLRSDPTWVVSGEELTLSDREGTELVFRRRPPESPVHHGD
jgi:heat shock protein HslJ